MVIKIYMIFCLIIICLLIYSLIVPYFFEIKRRKEQEEIERFKKKYKLNPPNVPEEYKNMSLQDYIYYKRNKFSRLATIAFNNMDDTEEDVALSDFGLKLEYYSYCKSDLSEYKTEILGLWNDFFDLFDMYEYSDDLRKGDLLILAALVRRSGIYIDGSDSLDNRLLSLIDNERRNFTEFSSQLSHIISWCNFRFDAYLNIMGLGVTIHEVEHIKLFWSINEDNFSNLKTSNAVLAGAFYQIVKESFNRFKFDRDIYRFISLYKQVAYWVLDVYKALDEGERYSEVYIDYRRVKRRSLKRAKLYWDYLLDYTTGYGEKPIKLLFIFIGSIAFFSVVYYPYNFSPFDFKNLKEESLLSTIVSVIYLNFTIMLSNLFGHITPENALTKLFVIIQQVIGFTLTGSFIALFLRKLFRD